MKSFLSEHGTPIIIMGLISIMIGLIVYIVHATGNMHYQVCDVMGFKAGTPKNSECVSIMANAPKEFRGELLKLLSEK